MNQKEISEDLAEMLKKGHVRIVGEEDGEPVYELTDEGKKVLFYLSSNSPELDQ